MDDILRLEECDSNTQLVFTALLSALEESIADGQLKNVVLYRPGMSDGFILNAFSKKIEDNVDIVYYLCIEDMAEPNIRLSNFKFVDNFFAEFREYMVSEHKIYRMDGYNIIASGTLSLSNRDHTCYYLTFCLELVSNVANA